MGISRNTRTNRLKTILRNEESNYFSYLLDYVNDHTFLTVD